MSLARFLAPAAFAVLLSGCFVSVMPLFGPDQADMPLKNGAQITGYALNDKGEHKDQKPTHMVATLKTKSYVFTPDKDEPFRAMFDKLDDNFYVGVILDMQVNKPPLYGLFHQVGDKWFGYSPVCADFQKLAATKGKSLADFNIVANPNGSDCQFRKYDDLKSALMFLAAYGKPDTEYVLGK
ncbi:MAG: hypothetical protein ACOH12_12650 [Parvibaculaceae bacterium]